MSKSSRFLSLILRHKPEAGGITLDQEGWAPVRDVIGAIKRRHGDFKLSDLEQLVTDCDKQRFAFNGARNKIRASQGHSVSVDLKIKESDPPAVLFHGTKTKNLNSIMKTGLVSGKRNHVHLSSDIETAKIVAARREGTSAILQIDTSGVAKPFYKSDNNVWLVEGVPSSAIHIIFGED